MRLEIGVGFGKDGDLRQRRYKFNPRVCGSDVVYIELRKPEDPEFKRLGNWVVADAQHLPFKSDIFDEVYASHVIEHLPDVHMFFSEVRRVMKCMGRLYIWTPNFMSPNATRDPTHKHIFSFMSLGRMLKTYGFKPHYGGINIAPFFKPFYLICKLICLIICNELFVMGEKLPAREKKKKKKKNSEICMT